MALLTFCFNSVCIRVLYNRNQNIDFKMFEVTIKPLKFYNPVDYWIIIIKYITVFIRIEAWASIFYK